MLTALLSRPTPPIDSGAIAAERVKREFDRQLEIIEREDKEEEEKRNKKDEEDKKDKEEKKDDLVNPCPGTYAATPSKTHVRPMSRTSSDMDNCAEPGDVPGLQDAKYGCTRDVRARTMP